jgi:hypothetical protein
MISGLETLEIRREDLDPGPGHGPDRDQSRLLERTDEMVAAAVAAAAAPAVVAVAVAISGPRKRRIEFPTSMCDPRTALSCLVWVAAAGSC